MLDRSSPTRILSCDVVSGVRALPQGFWDEATAGDAENAAYYTACEAVSPSPRALAVQDMLGVVAAAPLFDFVYPLDTPLQGRLAGPGRALRRCAGPLMEWRALAIGSPLTEGARLAFRPGLTAPEKDAAFDALVAGLESEGRRSGAAAIGFKDLSEADSQRFGDRLAARNYAKVRSLPVAVLDLATARTPDDYLAALSASTRKDIRRKLKRAGGVRVEWRDAIGDCADAVRALYEETRTTSEVRYGDFEELPEGYFERMGRLPPDQARFVLYWVGETLAAFNLLLLLGPDRVIDKFIGLRQPLARDHDLYAVSWMENVAFALRTGRRYLQTGQTAYGEKLRFGSTLEPRTIYGKHRLPPLNAALRAAAGRLAFDRWDPDLRRLAVEGRFTPTG